MSYSLLVLYVHVPLLPGVVVAVLVVIDEEAAVAVLAVD